jgi:peroxin-6
MDRTYQPMFLRSLKTYFDLTKRLVKQGDLIAVNLDTDVVGRFGDSLSDELADPEELCISDEQ